MTDKQLIKNISKMNAWELLSFIIDSSTDLTDGYYSEFRDAILKRHEELLKEHSVTDVN